MQGLYDTIVARRDLHRSLVGLDLADRVKLLNSGAGLDKPLNDFTLLDTCIFIRILIF